MSEIKQFKNEYAVYVTQRGGETLSCAMCLLFQWPIVSVTLIFTSLDIRNQPGSWSSSCKVFIFSSKKLYVLTSVKNYYENSGAEIIHTPEKYDFIR